MSGDEPFALLLEAETQTLRVHRSRPMLLLVYRLTPALAASLLVACTPSSGSLGFDDDDAATPDPTPVADDDDDDAVPPDDDDSAGPDGICSIDFTCTDSVIWDSPKRNCTVVITEDDGDEKYNGFAGLERRGRSSLNWEKSNYALEFWERESELLLPPFSEWRYLNAAATPGLEWTTSDFDDSAWSTGDAPFGWENQANLGLGTYITRRGYTNRFRTTFEVADPTVLDPIHLHARFDDGAIFFLNGVEVARLNMPEGDVGPDTPASTVHHYQDEIVWDNETIDNVLIAGVNVLAVELHQIVEESADAVLDVAINTKPPTVSQGFFGMGGDADWVLGGAYVDLTQYRNSFLYDLYNDFRPGVNYAPESHYCEVTLNNDWRGLYQLTEKIKRDDDRLNLVDDAGAGGSFIIKSDDTRPFYPTDFVRGGFQLVWPKPKDMTEAGRDEIFSVLAAWQVAARTNQGLWDIVDLDSAVDWVLLQQFGRNGDMYNLSIHVYRDNFGKLKFVPWDMDLVFGLSCAGASSFDLFTGDVPDLSNGFRGDPVFHAALEARWIELREGVLSNDSVFGRLDDIRDLFGETIHENFVRWPEEDMIGADDWVLSFPSGCPSYTWASSDSRARDWIEDRLRWLDRNIDRYPN